MKKLFFTFAFITTLNANPNSVIWCDLAVVNADSNNVQCIDKPTVIKTTVSEFTSDISLMIDGIMVGTETFDESIYAANSQLTYIWSSDIYTNLAGLAIGNHIVRVVTENANTGAACYSEIEFTIESCETSSGSIVVDGLNLYKLNIKMYLEAYLNEESQTMKTTINELSLIPAAQPFRNTPMRYAGNESFLAINDQDTSIVDWVLVCLRSQSGQILEKKAALLFKDGSVREATTFDESIIFKSSVKGSYHVSVNHRSHLGIMSELAYPSESLLDFGEGIEKGIVQTKFINGVHALFAGDIDGNNVINNIDYNIWARNNAVVNTYEWQDIDGNGIVNNQDYNCWAGNRSVVGVIEMLDYPF